MIPNDIGWYCCFHPGDPQGMPLQLLGWSLVQLVAVLSAQQSRQIPKHLSAPLPHACLTSLVVGILWETVTGFLCSVLFHPLLSSHLLAVSSCVLQASLVLDKSMVAIPCYLSVLLEQRDAFQEDLLYKSSHGLRLGWLICGCLDPPPCSWNWLWYWSIFLSEGAFHSLMAF